MDTYNFIIVNIYSLFSSTFKAFDFNYCKPINLMALFDVLFVQVLFIIMTEPTMKKFLALRALLHASSSIMLTTILHRHERVFLPLYLFFLFFFIII